jgi:hypothetical protein
MKSIKTLSFFTLLCLSNICFSQDFSVPLSICDSIGPNSFEYKIQGSCLLNESMTLHAELINNASKAQVIYGEFNVSNPTISSLPYFVYDESSKTYSFNFGIQNESDHTLHIWTTNDGIIQNEIYATDLY